MINFRSVWVMFKMKKRNYCFLIATLHIVSWISTASRPFDDAHQQDTAQILHSSQVAFEPNQELEKMEQVKGNEEAYRGLSTLGSRPPNCGHKCGGCIPCIAIQVPTTSDHLGVQYANYEPEGWKCKCGTSFFNP